MLSKKMIKAFIIIILLTTSFLLGKKLMKPENNSNTSSNIIIPRSVLFGNPDKTSVLLSDDAKYISYLAPKDNVLNIFIAPRQDINSAKPVTNDTHRGIRSYSWGYNNKHIFYLQDIGGDENWQLHKINIETLEDTNLTPEPGIRTDIYKISRKFPNKIIIGNNARDKTYFDLFELDVLTNEKKLIFTNNEYSSFTFDDDYNLRFLHKSTEDGGTDIFSYNNNEAKFFFNIPAEDVTTTYLAGFDKSGNILYMANSLDTDTSKLISWDLTTNEKKDIFYDQKTNISGILRKTVTKEIQAVSSSYIKEQWTIIDTSIKQDFDYLSSLSQGEINILSRTSDDKFWIVAYLLDDYPVSYYLYDRDAKNAQKLFTNRKDLENYSLSKMQGIVIKSRDGLDLVSYLTLPLESLENKDSLRPRKPVPMVLLVHGGPSVRDGWGLNVNHQWLANRGYGVLSVNYRGSTGFGKKFFKEGHGQWSAKMHDDLVDAVNFAIAENIAQKDKICIMGGSYGGYATLVGLTFTPDLFTCGVDIVGPSNLLTLLETIPPYWKPALKFLINLTGGDPATTEGQKILQSKSPLNYVDKIKKPLLIGQGANDPRVKQSESDQIVTAMKSKNIPVTYILYPDEGHGFARPENRMSFNAIVEGFLATYLNGKFEPMNDDAKNSSIKIIEGENFVSGLKN